MFFSRTAGGGGGLVWVGSRSPELLFCLPRASLTWVPHTHLVQLGMV